MLLPRLCGCLLRTQPAAAKQLLPDTLALTRLYPVPTCWTAARWRSTGVNYSSTGNLASVQAQLGLDRITTMIVHGKPNREFPAELGVEIEAMTEGSKQAISLVTGFMDTEEYDKLDGLVSPECIAGLRMSLLGLQSEDRKHIHIDPDNIFFSFIRDFKSNPERQTLLLVVFWFPGLVDIKAQVQQRKESIRETKEKIKQSFQDGAGDPNSALESLNNQKLDDTDINSRFTNNEILIGNFRFERKDQNSDWTIVEISQVNSVDAWSWIFRKRWKGRLGISLRGGFDFYKVLRYDYLTDWIAYTILFYFIIGSSMASGMMPAPPS